MRCVVMFCYSCKKNIENRLKEMFKVRLVGDHLYGKWLFIWLSLVMSLMVSYFALFFFVRIVLDEIWV